MSTLCALIILLLRTEHTTGPYRLDAATMTCLYNVALAETALQKSRGQKRNAETLAHVWVE
jgi:hypothetical protein